MNSIKKAAQVLGSQQLLAVELGVSPSFVSQWSTGVRKVPATLCKDIERLTGGAVTCLDLRPDVFGDQAAGKVA